MKAKALRILHLVHQYPPHHLGGVELYTRSIAQILAARRHGVAIFTRAEGTQGELRTYVEDGVEVHVAYHGSSNPTRRFLATFGDPELARAFCSVLDHFRPDLLHIQHLMGLPKSLLDIVQERRIPFVVTLHDFWWVCANAQLLTNYSRQICHGPSLWLNCAHCAIARSQRPAAWAAAPALIPLLAWRGWMLKAVLGRAARLIAPTLFVKQWYASHGVDGAHIAVLPLGVDCPALPPRRPPDPHIPLRVAYIGGLSWQKGVHVLLQAVAQLQGMCELWIAGDLAFDFAYSSQLRSMATPNVRFLGKLARQQVWETLAAVDVVAVPSLWYETFSLLTHEAFAAGVPVLASRLGALAEVVQHQVDGLLVEPNDARAWRAALQQLVDTPSLLESLRSRVRPPLTVAEHADQLFDIYRESVGTM